MGREMRGQLISKGKCTSQAMEVCAVPQHAPHLSAQKTALHTAANWVVDGTVCAGIHHTVSERGSLRLLSRDRSALGSSAGLARTVSKAYAREQNVHLSVVCMCVIRCRASFGAD